MTAESDGDEEPSTQRTKRKLEDLSSGDEPTKRAKSITTKKRRPTKVKHVAMDLDSDDSAVVFPVKKVANGGVYLFINIVICE